PYILLQNVTLSLISFDCWDRVGRTNSPNYPFTPIMLSVFPDTPKPIIQAATVSQTTFNTSQSDVHITVTVVVQSLAPSMLCTTALSTVLSDPRFNRKLVFSSRSNPSVSGVFTLQTQVLFPRFFPTITLYFDPT